MELVNSRKKIIMSFVVCEGGKVIGVGVRIYVCGQNNF